MRPALFIIGPTASGKTGLAVAAARTFDGEVISADSRQFYRGMDLGTGKDLHEFSEGGPAVPYHLIDMAEPDQPLNIHDFFLAYRDALTDVIDRKKLPVICGGSGLYVETALGRNPLAAIPDNPELRQELRALDRAELETRFDALPAEVQSRMDRSTMKRMIRAIEVGTYLKTHPEPTAALPTTRPVFVALDIDREARRARISTRLRQRFEDGMLGEVERLLAKGISAQRLRYYGLEYQCMVDHLEGHTSFEEMFKRLETDIHRFAKRQMTWFRRMEKRGDELHWLPYNMPREAQLEQISGWLTP